MDKVQGLSKGTQLLGASAILLFIDLFLRWQEACAGPFCAGQNGWHGFWGIVLGLLTIAVIAWVVLRVVQPQLLENVPVPEGTLALGLGALILVCAVIKNLADDYSHWPAYVGVILAAGVAAGGYLVAQEQGGTQKAMAWRPSSGASSAAPPPPPPAPEPGAPAAEPPAPEQTYSPPPQSPDAPPAEER